MVVVCGVDNDYTRVFSRVGTCDGYTRDFVGVNDNADYGYVFVQKGKLNLHVLAVCSQMQSTMHRQCHVLLDQP